MASLESGRIACKGRVKLFKNLRKYRIKFYARNQRRIKERERQEQQAKEVERAKQTPVRQFKRGEERRRVVSVPKWRKSQMIVELKKQLGITSIPKKLNFYLGHAVNAMLENGEDDISAVIAEWKEQENNYKSTEKVKYPMMLYYWYKERRLSSDDYLFYKVYKKVAKKKGIDLTGIKVTWVRGCGEDLIGRLREMIKGHGNDINLVTREYLNVVISNMLNFKPSLATSFKTLTGNWAWQTWKEYISKEYGSVKYGYLIPTKKQQEADENFRKLLDPLSIIMCEYRMGGCLNEMKEIRAVMHRADKEEMLNVIYDHGFEPMRITSANAA